MPMTDLTEDEHAKLRHYRPCYWPIVSVGFKPGGLARRDGPLAAAAREAAFTAADVLGPTLVGRVAARRMRASARA
jgi:hypothetical protein